MGREFTMRFLGTVLLAVAFLAAVALAKEEGKGIDGASSTQRGGPVTYDVRDYGAVGTKEKSSQAAIQKAIDACAAAGGGMVYVPPGQYRTGRLNLASHVRLYLEAGATLCGSRDPNDWPRGRNAILCGENLVSIAIEGDGTIDGQAEHEWLPYTQKTDRMIQDRIETLKRDRPDGMPFARWTRPVYNLVYLRNCTDVRMTGVRLIDSPIWNVHFLGCERVVVDGVYIHSSLVDGVNSDGINPNGCKDVRISNCTIITGDDCISLKSRDFDGAARACENITITNCRLSSASAAVKIGDEIAGPVRHVAISNCVITDSHRAFAFMVLDGGTVSDVVISNLTIECRRHAWFWWGQGDAFYFMIGRRNDTSKIGRIENILVRDVIAHVKGSSIIEGHPESPLTGIRFANVKMFLSDDPNAYFREAVHGMQARYARDFSLDDVEMAWCEPSSDRWKSALYVEDVEGLMLGGFAGRQAHRDSQEPAVMLRNVVGADIRACRALRGTDTFLSITGERSRDIRLFANDFTAATRPLYTDGRDAEVIAHASGNAGYP
mgnify:CR=1 FL=1|jgi:hypothetical protein